MVCRYCNQDKPEEEFEVANVIKGVVYRRRKCKRCKQDTQNIRRTKHREWITDYKAKKGCKQCGFSDPRALSFHHVDPKEKNWNVTEMGTWSINEIKKEIDKCEVLCCNCHMILEAELREK